MANILAQAAGLDLAVARRGHPPWRRRTRAGCAPNPQITQTIRRPWLAVGPAQRGQAELWGRGLGEELCGARVDSNIIGSCAPRAMGRVANPEALFDIVGLCTYVLLETT